MNVEIDLAPDVMAFYVTEATMKGIPLARYIAEQLTANARNGAPKRAAKGRVRQLNLPQMQGTILGSLRRQDIYDERD
jgi:hypothetical protein